MTKIFDKRNDFDFKIVKYPHVLSNIPDRIVYNVFVSQMLRIARVCSGPLDLIETFKVLILNFKGKGCKTKILISKAKKTFSVNAKTFKKFNLTWKDFENVSFR